MSEIFEPEKAPVELQSDQRPAVIQLLDKIIVFSNSIGSVWVFLLVILVCADAAGRTLSFTGYTAPIKGVIELVEVSIIVIVFTQLADTVRVGRLTRSDGFLSLMLRRSPAFGRILSMAIDLLAFVFLLLILIGAVPLLVDSYQRGYFHGDEGVFTLPDWPGKAVIVYGATLTLLRFLANTYQTAIGPTSQEQ